MEKIGVPLTVLVLLLSACGGGNFSSICNCGIDFHEKDLRAIRKDDYEGFHGDGYVLSAFKYSELTSQDVVRLGNKEFIGRNKAGISFSELDAVLPYDSLQICYMHKAGDGKSV